MNKLCKTLAGLAFLAGPLSASQGSEVAPDSLPFKWSQYDEATIGAKDVKTVLPEELKPFMKESPLAFPIAGVEIKGEVNLIRPISGKSKLEDSYSAQVWDKLLTAGKSQLSFEAGEGVKVVLGAHSSLQVLAYRGSVPVLRLFKGRMRLEVQEGKKCELETLNAELIVSEGTTDVIISAMNTLVAPRTGESVDVLTRKARKSVPTGLYGLVMADGSLVFTGHKKKG